MMNRSKHEHYVGIRAGTYKYVINRAEVGPPELSGSNTVALEREKYLPYRRLCRSVLAGKPRFPYV